MSDVEYRHFVSKAMAAKEGGEAAWAVQSTGEKVAVALALNRADWLALMNYTMAEAIERRSRYLRDFAHDRHRTVDDSPYGGGAGMVMKPEPWGEALRSVLAAGDLQQLFVARGDLSACWVLADHSSPYSSIISKPSVRNSPTSGWPSR